MKTRVALGAVAIASLAAEIGCGATTADRRSPDEETSTTASALAALIPESMSAGTSSDLDAYLPSQQFSLPPGKAMVDIVGVAIATGNDHVYTWFADGTVTSGTSTNPDFYLAPYAYTLPGDRTPADIVGIGIASNNHVYTWYDDGTFSIGASPNLAQYQAPQAYSLPPGKTPADIVAMDIASNDHVYAWYRDGTASSGTSANLDFYLAPYPYVLPAGRKPNHVLDMAIAGNDHVYAWYQDMETGVAYAPLADAVDKKVVDTMRTNQIVGLSVAASKNGRVVINRGYGYRNADTQESHQAHHRSRIGSVSKVITALGVVKFAEESPSFSLDTKVYGTDGVLSDIAYPTAMVQGIIRHIPVVGFGIGSGDHVYAWYANGTMSIGHSGDLDYYSAPQAYTLPAGKTPVDIIGVAIASNGKVYAWYTDGTRSVGTPTALAAESSGTEFAAPAGTDAIQGIAIRPSDDHLFVWYANGRFSSGTSTDFDYYSSPADFVVPPGYSPYDIVEMDIASTGRVYTRFKDGRVSSGTPTDLDAYAAPYVSQAGAGASGPDWLAWYGQMTSKHLLSHSAGFWGSGDTDGAAAYFGVDVDDLTYALVNQFTLATRPLLFAPGTDEAYSNHSVGLAGHVLATASGMSFDDYIRQHVFDPLGLDQIVENGTVNGAADAMTHKVADGVIVTIPQPATNHLGLAAGGWSASALDLVHLMLATDQLPNRPDLLSPASLQVMEQQPFPGASSYALGWDSNSSGKLAKNGAETGGTAYIVKFPVGYQLSGVDVGGITVAVCENSSGDSSVLKNISDDIAKAAGGLAIPATEDYY